ncbi:hypothetical protein KAW11_03750 [Candidatus Bathyarchaeota archaeon]|nr:hypothetical protein [Candidatus Bathyarchaeota archaeon]
MLRVLLALSIPLGVIALICWLVLSRIFVTFETLGTGAIYQGGMIVSMLLPFLLLGFLGLVLYLKSRD